MEEQGNVWSAEKQHHIHREAHDDIKPEHGVIVIVGRLFDIHQGLCESTALQVACNERENGEDADDAIVGR